MKKNILSLAVIVAALAFAMPSQAQIKFGIKGGLNVDNINLKHAQANVSAKNRTGFFAGDCRCDHSSRRSRCRHRSAV